MHWLRTVCKCGRGFGGALPVKRKLLAAATGRSAGEEKCVGTSVIPGVDEWERPFTLASLRDACGQDNTPFRALLSPTSVAGNCHARGERHSVGSRPEKVCVMEVMGCSDLEAEFVLDAVPSLLQAGVRIIRGVLVYALGWTSWRCGSGRGGVAGGWGRARETYIARKMCGGGLPKPSRVWFK